MCKVAFNLKELHVWELGWMKEYNGDLASKFVGMWFPLGHFNL